MKINEQNIGDLAIKASSLTSSNVGHATMYIKSNPNPVNNRMLEAILTQCLLRMQVGFK